MVQRQLYSSLESRGHEVDWLRRRRVAVGAWNPLGPLRT
jgi:hypothetical protein